MATVLVHISLLAYAAGAAAFLTWLVKPGPRWVRLGRLLLLAGVLLHFGAFGVALGSAEAEGSADALLVGVEDPELCAEASTSSARRVCMTWS